MEEFVMPLFRKEENSYLIFIRRNQPEYIAEIVRPPGFFDALQLMRNSSCTPYQILPLRLYTRITIHFTENHQHKIVQVHFYEKKVSVIEKIGKISRGTAYKLLGCFLIKNGSRFLFLSMPPNNRVKVRKISNPLNLTTHV